MNVKLAFTRNDERRGAGDPLRGRRELRQVRSSGVEPKIAITDHLGAMAFQSVLVNSR